MPRRAPPDPDVVFRKLVLGLFGVALLAVAVQTVLLLPAITLDQRKAAAVYMLLAFVLWLLAGVWAMRRWP